MTKFKILSISFLVLLLFSTHLYGQQRYKIPLENSPFIGPENAPVTIVEFIDYQ